MMRIRARGAVALKANRYDQVLQLVESGLEEFRQFYREHERMDLMEQSGEIQSLEAWLQEIQAKRPLSRASAWKAPSTKLSRMRIMKRRPRCGTPCAIFRRKNEPRPPPALTGCAAGK